MPKVRTVPEGVPFYGPKSMCSCGHEGDGIVTQHEDRFSPGHGACTVKGCICAQFTWVAWTKEYKERMGLK